MQLKTTKLLLNFSEILNSKSSWDYIISFFSDIVHDVRWPWSLKTDEARFLKKKNGAPKLGLADLNLAENEVFCQFLKFGS